MGQYCSSFDNVQPGDDDLTTSDSASDSTTSESISTVPAKPTPILFKQPLDIFLEIVSHLDPSSAASLSLTCKNAFALLAPASLSRLTTEDKGALLQLWERDANVGSSFYFCHLCTKLHPFAPWWGPKTRSRESCRFLASENYAHFLLSWKPSGSYITVAYHHARLVMNRHLYGPELGLDLDSFTVREGPRKIHRNLDLVQSMTARIINDMLVLRIEHEITPASAEVPPDGFRKEVDEAVCKICEHMQTHKLICSTWRTISEIGVQEAETMFSPCRNAPGSCERCTTDLETTIEFGMERTSSEWRINIVSYHLLGQGRTPWEAEAGGFFYDQSSRSSERDVNKYPFGSIRQMWFKAGFH
ncbi:hypothetical protein PT974_00466 [Cladobotryum mycophilum]|uniref:F-box domain-containing protein n=1 Tax=Cladobotryum mycophilum TaxID=491253 RepID=A0ABR0T156_9HYPO